MRLPSRERRQAIVTAVQGAFADKGFDGTTTRELARAAGVSEALLYKHFPSKESLYGAMLDACAEGPFAAEWGRILTLPASTSTLVVLVHLLTAHFVQCDDLQKTTMHRLALRSLLEDADFARLGAKQFGASWVRKVEACIKAAVKAGDRLSETELVDLLRLRDMVERSSNCPHGRPTSIRLTIRELEKRFGRV